ncbi:MAG: hypothetical protein KGQ89_02000 [Verrucomicrobia bacterium]|nr:hypothetical protein [Verrucomicrobiota bacterium]
MMALILLRIKLRSWKKKTIERGRVLVRVFFLPTHLQVGRQARFGRKYLPPGLRFLFLLTVPKFFDCLTRSREQRQVDRARYLEYEFDFQSASVMVSQWLE